MQTVRKKRSVVPMRTAKTGSIAASLLLAVLGVFLMLRPEVSTAVIGNLAGSLLLVFGIVRIIGFFSKDLYRLAFQFDLAFGLLMVVLGIVILTRPEHLLHFLCVATGLYVTADSLMKLQIANDARVFGLRRWWMILAASLLTVTAGILLMVFPSQSTLLLIRLFGGVMLAEGILNLVTVLLAVKIVRNQVPDIIEIQCTEGAQ